jgi:hypothetical protein
MLTKFGRRQRALMIRVRLCALVIGLSLLMLAHAEPKPMDDADMAAVTGQDGIGFAVHLEMNSAVLDGAEMNSRLTAGFNVNGLTTYAIALNVGGIIDMYAMTLNLRTRPDGGDYIDLGLPFFVGVSQFGYRALSAQTDPTGPITHNYGQLLLNGHVAMQGHLYLWAN